MKHLAIALVAGLMCSPALVLSHGDKKHVAKEEAPEVKPEKAIRDINLVLMAINKDYKNTVKPLFEQKCFDCHSDKTDYPWYYRIPGIKGFIDGDIAEAREHLDLSKDFPFGGHGDPAEDLEELEKVISEGSMPPFQYRLMHWGSGFSEAEKELILAWIRTSLRKSVRSAYRKNKAGAFSEP